jgi:hypothetical protein
MVAYHKKVVKMVAYHEVVKMVAYHKKGSSQNGGLSQGSKTCK